jgi:hypothetical protein
VRRITILSFFLVAACGGSNPPPPTTSSAAPTAAPPTEAVAATGPFDRNAARKAIDAVDADSCASLIPPTLVEQPLHVRITFSRDGRVMDVAADGAFAGTPAGKCAEDKYRSVHIAPFDGPLTTIGKSVSHVKETGDPSAPPFDPAPIRAEAAKIDLSECDTYLGNEDHGRARVSVRPNGEIRSVIIEGSLNATTRGTCVEKKLHDGIHGKAYSGPQAPGVDVDFVIKPKK